MQPSNISNLLYQQLAFSGEKQKIISSNIANINTPNYKTQEIRNINNNSFENILKLKQTNQMHINDNTKKDKNDFYIKETSNLNEQNDGNNVSLDREISKMAKNEILYNAITNSIKKDATLFKMVIESSSKN